MYRLVSAAFALLVTLMAVSSACVAAGGHDAAFSLYPGSRPGEIQARFDFDGRRGSDWTTSLKMQVLTGLDPSALRGPGQNPLRFSIARDTGRLDCAGQGGGGQASGRCDFSVSAPFAQRLRANGIAPPTRKQWIGLFATDVRTELVTAIAAARYPAPSIDSLMALAAVGVSSRYIADMTAAGYRPSSVASLIELKALDVTPRWIGDLVRVGYARLSPSELVQLKALDISADYIRGLEAVGYRGLPTDTLVQLKALGVTPDFARAMQRKHGSVSARKLVELRAVGDLAYRH